MSDADADLARSRGRFRALFDRLTPARPVAGEDRLPSASVDPRLVYILPTRAGLGYGAVLLGMLLGSLNYQSNLALLFTFLMIATAVVSMHHCWLHLLKLRLSAGDGSAVFAGQDARLPVTITEAGGRPRRGICVRDGACIDLDAGGQTVVWVARPTRRRGTVALGRAELETRYPLGLFRAWTRVPLRAQALVYPTPAARAPSRWRQATAEVSDTGSRGSGAEDFLGLRLYLRGDPPARIDWKALARERGLVVKQFGADRSADLWLDWYRVPGADEERLSRLARQIIDAHGNGAAFGLRLPGLQIEPGRGETHKRLCLAALARYPDAH